MCNKDCANCTKYYKISKSKYCYDKVYGLEPMINRPQVKWVNGKQEYLLSYECLSAKTRVYKLVPKKISKRSYYRKYGRAKQGNK